MFAKLRNFFIESRDELKKVQWPTRREAAYLTVVVIGISLILGVFTGGLDALLAYLLQLLFQR